MATLSTLIVKLVGESSSFAKELEAAEERARGFSKNIQEIGNKVSGIGTGLTAAVTAPVGMLFDKAINSASDLSETVSKTSVVFGENSDQVMKWADNAAKSMGQSKQQALDAASTYGNLFVSMRLPVHTAISSCRWG